MKVKKTLSLLLSLVMLLSASAGLDLSVFANDLYGKCGEDVTYLYDPATSTLTISGTGPMYNYDCYNDDYSPIYKLYRNIYENDMEIQKVIINSGVTTIGDSMFYAMDIESVTMPNTITRIGDYAFIWNWNRLDNIVVPSSVKEIGVAAFNQCGNLHNITLPSEIENIGRYAFYITGYTEDETNCKNGGYYIGEYLVKVKKYFTGDFTVKNGTTLIADYVFWDADAETTKITVCDGVKRIGKGAFGWQDCNLTIPVSVVEIGEDSTGYNKEVTYNGTKTQWDNISKGEYNTPHTLICLEQTYYEHSYYKETESATCTSPGVENYICGNCGYSYTETIAKKPHTYKVYTTKATTKKNGSIVTKCSVCGAKKSSATIYSPKTISLSTTTYTYNGKVRTPSVTVKDSKGKTLKKNTDYTVTYAKGRKAVGKYTVTIKFKGNYSGTVTRTFTIKPKSTSISKLTAGKKKFTVKWKKQTSQTTGYQIQYSTSSKFKNAKTVTVSKNKTTSKSVSKLKAKKKYYIRVRTYKSVNGTKIYSGWSKAKAVTTKK